MDFDMRVRLAAFEWLSEQVKAHADEVLPRTLLLRGFEFSGERVPLVSPRGIHIPRILDFPLSVTTAPNSPYRDVITEEGFILYKYFGNDPQHRDNVGLRQAMERQLPLVYFHGLVPGSYLAVWPAYVVDDNPGALEFKVAVDESRVVESHAGRMVHEDDRSRKAYITRETRFRLHQRTFRERVLRAYREQCALCKLRHRELLDAAHIIPDSEEHGQATVNNGISLCKLHHAAFDNFLIGITPDFKVEVSRSILEETDGPTLEHCLKEIHDSSIILPGDEAHWPDRDFLSQRYSEFSNAARQ